MLLLPVGYAFHVASDRFLVSLQTGTSAQPAAGVPADYEIMAHARSPYTPESGFMWQLKRNDANEEERVPENRSCKVRICTLGWPNSASPARP